MVIKTYEILQVGQIVTGDGTTIIWDSEGNRHWEYTFMVMRILTREEYLSKRKGKEGPQDVIRINDPKTNFYEISLD